MFARLVKPLRLLGQRSYTLMAENVQKAGPLESAIRDKLISLLHPTSITIRNDSWKHRHHAAMRELSGSNEETHFSIRIISNAFVGKSLIQRHRMVNSTLSEEFAQGLHALSLETRTEEELARLTK